MEDPVPDLIYYQNIVDNSIGTKFTILFELQELINEVKIYMKRVAQKNNEFHRMLNEEVLKRTKIEKGD